MCGLTKKRKVAIPSYYTLILKFQYNNKRGSILNTAIGVYI